MTLLSQNSKSSDWHSFQIMSNKVTPHNKNSPLWLKFENAHTLLDKDILMTYEIKM